MPIPTLPKIYKLIIDFGFVESFFGGKKKNANNSQHDRIIYVIAISPGFDFLAKEVKNDGFLM